MTKELKYYIKLDEEGKRISPGYREDGNVPDDVKASGILVTKDIFSKLCNGYLLDPDTKLLKEIPPYEPSLKELQEAKIAEFKTLRDAEEIAPVEYKGQLFDYDSEKSVPRINEAIGFMERNEVATQEWTLADNSRMEVTVSDLYAVKDVAAMRSGALHDKYNTIKEKALNCKSKTEIEVITW